MRARCLIACAATGLGLVAVACNAILGIEDPIVDADASIDGKEEPPPTCGEAASLPEGIYVVQSVGGDITSCGGVTDPCKTITQGLARAKQTNRKVVYVARGQYLEQLKLEPGITIRGGFEVLDGKWMHACSPVNDVVHVRAPDDKNVTVLADDLGVEAGLELLTIESKPLAARSESLYGIMARGTSTVVKLVDVVVQVAAGGEGLTGMTGDAGASGTGSCPTGDGGPGLTPDAAGAGSDGGGFDAAGYDPAMGGVGLPGTPGSAGGIGADGGCVRCVGSCAAVTCAEQSVSTACGSPGASGCGGFPGGGGVGGRGGGSSIAIFVWDAKVEVRGGALRTGGGGVGGRGGPGGDGGAGSVGDAGANSATCKTVCNGLVGCSHEGDDAGRGGAGSRGGPGGTGGIGGGGAGGHSYAVFKGGTANVTVDGSTVLEAKDGGAGGLPNGAPGSSGATFPP